MVNTYRIFIPILLFFLVQTSQASNRLSDFAKNNVNNIEVDLRIGDKAPEIKAQWIKGQPIQQFSPGMVYVLEFWATWCVPCIKAMPHISDLADKYSGKATFIGVSVWERGRPGKSIRELVEGFVKKAKDSMRYNVCMDDSTSFMADNWLTASAQSSIPTTIIVGKDGRISWIGKPMDMDEPLEKIVQGTFDRDAFAKEYAKDQEEAFSQQNKHFQIKAVRELVNDAVKSKDYKLVMSLYDSITLNDPAYKNYLIRPYYSALMRLNPDNAYKSAIGLKDSLRIANVIAEIFANEEGVENRFYQYAIDVFESQKTNLFILSPLSAAYFHTGKYDKAVNALQGYLDYAKTWTAPLPVEVFEAEMARLKKYKQIAKQQ